jgi:tRNA(Ile)-lysidine synthase
LIVTKKILSQMNALNGRHGLVRRGDRVLIALSGGPDSTALAHLLVLWRRKYGLKLAAAHLHHGLSKQNDRAMKLARATAQELGLPFYSKKTRVRALAKKEKLSLEEAGRDARYAFFRSLSRRLKMTKIATAHTRDDQAETVMMRIIRGCGLHGLTGIPAKRPLGDAQVIRPLLDCRKKDLLLFLAQNGVRYQTDRSNTSARFTRNRVRHELLPWIGKHLNPSIHDTLAGLAERAAPRRRRR